MEWKWDREQFLNETCRKAGLPPDAWRQGARIQAFTAQVFEETDPAPATNPAMLESVAPRSDRGPRLFSSRTVSFPTEKTRERRPLPCRALKGIRKQFGRSQ